MNNALPLVIVELLRLVLDTLRRRPTRANIIRAVLALVAAIIAAVTLYVTASD